MIELNKNIPDEIKFYLNEIYKTDDGKTLIEKTKHLINSDNFFQKSNDPRISGQFMPRFYKDGEEPYGQPSLLYTPLSDIDKQDNNKKYRRMTMLFHELCHADQFENNDTSNLLSFEPDSLLRMSFVIEPDAMAKEYLFHKQYQKLNDQNKITATKEIFPKIEEKLSFDPNNNVTKENLQELYTVASRSYYSKGNNGIDDMSLSSVNILQDLAVSLEIDKLNDNTLNQLTKSISSEDIIKFPIRGISYLEPNDIENGIKDITERSNPKKGIISSILNRSKTGLESLIRMEKYKKQKYPALSERISEEKTKRTIIENKTNYQQSTLQKTVMPVAENKNQLPIVELKKIASNKR